MSKGLQDPASLSRDIHVQIYWVVSSLQGIRKVNDASVDVFDNYSDALKEAKNRGKGWVPLVMNPQAVVMELLRENYRLSQENEKLRKAMDYGPNS